MPLDEYRKKRDFQHSPEPAGTETGGGRIFVVQKHAATNLHYDLRLEWNGVLKSWAVPKGPSLNPAVKRLAVEVEDHPVEYANFEGVIPHGEYGEGTVLVWDRGTWQPKSADPAAKFMKGHIEFRLSGSKLSGGWSLVRMGEKPTGEAGRNWLLIKNPDEAARASAAEIIELAPDSVQSGRSLAEVAEQESTDEALRRRAARIDAAAAKSASADAIPGDQPETEPPQLEPELPTLSEHPPEGEEWIHEIKYDGYRILSYIEKGRVRMLSRRGNDWTVDFPALAAALARLPVERALLDGEVVARGPDGMIRFQNLQNARQPGGPVTIEYYLFDLLHLNGFSTRNLPLVDRKRLLQTLLSSVRDTEPLLRFSDGIRGGGAAVYRAACRTNLEGIVSKRAESPYLGGRTKDWLKSKCREEQEFVAGGYTLLQNSRNKIGALLLGYYEGGRLMYCGRVGTGFSENDRGALYERLQARRREDSPFAELPREEETAGAFWTEPQLVAEVRFAEWTEDGRLREPAFLGVREDKPAEAVGREGKKPAEGGDSPFMRVLPRQKSGPADPDPSMIGGVAFTHASKVMFPRERFTKRDLAEYYLQIADVFLSEIRRRPLVLVRCPEGVAGDCFFQKHAESSIPEFVPKAALPGAGDGKPFLSVESIRDVLGLVQADTLEFHVWGSRIDDPLHPDRIVFDLDPDPQLDPGRTIAAALDLRRILEEAGLIPFVRTTGGKGLHVVVPILPALGWDEVKTAAQRFAARLVRAQPDERTTAMAKQQRSGKVFVDFYRNVRGASAIASYSARAREGAPVATPLEWDEVRPGLAFNGFSLADVLARRERGVDPWKNMPEMKRGLPRDIFTDRR